MTSHTASGEDGVEVFVGGEPPEDSLEFILAQIDKENKELAAAGKDERMIGFQFVNGIDTGKTPLDFRIDPETGRTAVGGVPFSVSKADLRTGIKEVNLPCLFTWKKGRWLSDFTEKDAPLSALDVEKLPQMSAKKHNETPWEWHCWVVHGEGMPGAFSYYAYIVPPHISSIKQGEIPKHPMLWGKKYKEGIAGRFQAKIHWKWQSSQSGNAYQSAIVTKNRYEDSWELLLTGKLPFGNYGGGGGGPGSTWLPKPGGHTPAAPVKAVPSVTAVKADPLPTGIRFRCPGCGHWFDEHGFKGHSKVCPGMDSQGISDWAVMCHKDCGCEVLNGRELGDKTLDDVATCKPGFPRPKPEKKEVVATDKKESEAVEVVTGAD